MRRMILSLFALTTLLSVASAQPGQMRARQQQRLEQFKKIRLMEFLKLDEETSVRFFARYRQQQEKVRSIVERRSKSIDELSKNMKSDGEDVDYEAFIVQTVAMEREIIDAREEFLRGLKDILSNRQIAEYVIFERRFNQEVRGMLQQMQQRQRRF